MSRITRMFKGREYYLDDVRNSMRDAQRSVEAYRAKGYLARFTKITARRFGVWVREIEQKGESK